MEPHHRLATRQRGYGGGWRHRRARHAKGVTTWLWCERLSGQRASALSATLAWPRFAKDDLDLWRRNGTRGTRVR